ncbi:MAG: ABC transporter permease, partial [Nannocystaceae bacterium]
MTATTRATAIAPLVVFAAFVGLWQLACTLFSLPVFLVPGPGQVLDAALRQHSLLLTATAWTAAGALSGLFVSLLLGSVIAIAFSQSKLIARSFYPYAIFLQTVPVVALAPLIVIWFGPGFTSVVVVSVMISLFPVITNGTTGLTRIDPQFLELFVLNNATRWQVLTKLRLPGSIPYFVTGVRISSGLSVIGAIVGEFFAGYGSESFGLGYVVIQASGQLKTDLLFAAILASTL